MKDNGSFFLSPYINHRSNLTGFYNNFRPKRNNRKGEERKSSSTSTSCPQIGSPLAREINNRRDRVRDCSFSIQKEHRFAPDRKERDATRRDEVESGCVECLEPEKWGRGEEEAEEEETRERDLGHLDFMGFVQMRVGWSLSHSLSFDFENEINCDDKWCGI